MLSGGRLIRPGFQAEDFMEEVAFHQVLEGERVAFVSQMSTTLALGLAKFP